MLTCPESTPNTKTTKSDPLKADNSKSSKAKRILSKLINLFKNNNYSPNHPKTALISSFSFDKPIKDMFFLVFYFQYFIFFLTSNHITSVSYNLII